MPQQPVTPPGWYPHPSAPGWEAYWDGQAWGTETRPAAAPPAAPQAPATEADQISGQPAAAEAQARQQAPAEPQQQVAQQAAPAATPAVAEAGEDSSALPAILCVLGAVVAIVGCFLPVASSDVIIDIADNTLIAAGYGFVAIAAAVLGAAAAVYYYVKGGRSWLPIIFGAIVLAVAAYMGTIGLDPIPADSIAMTVPPDDGSPSTGVFVTAIGGILMILGGLGISREPK